MIGQKILHHRRIRPWRDGADFFINRIAVATRVDEPQACTIEIIDGNAGRARDFWALAMLDFDAETLSGVSKKRSIPAPWCVAQK